MAQELRAVEVAEAHRWRWVLTASSGRVLADHQVDLDPGTAEYEAFVDLIGHLDRHRLPHNPVGSETAEVDRIGAWISENVFGRTLLSRLSGAVRVVVPRGAEFLLSRPLELARVNGVSLARRQVSLVYEPADLGWPEEKEAVAGSVRILALFSMPARSSVLALRRERYELTRTVRTIAARSRKAIELRVLQYGVTRERLADAVEEYPGWDVLHVSGHGEAGVLLLEHPNGEPDPVSTVELVDLLAPARHRLKLAVLSACQSGASEAASTLHTLGLDELAEQVVPDGGSSLDQVGLARGLVTELGVTALAMRYPVADGFAVALAGELYPRLLGAGQPVDRAVVLAMAKAVGEQPTAAVPAASIGTPLLVGAGTVGLRVAPPPGRAVLDPYAERMAWFPVEPERFVGRTQVLVEASTALAPESGRSGVIFVGMVGAGKSACALELAHQHRGRFGALAWWRAPEQSDEFHQALIDFAASVETQLDIPMSAAAGTEAELRRFLPRLAAVLREEAVLLVLDNVDTLLTDDTTWRDPRWGLLIEALLSHGGLSRVVMTSRVLPASLDPGLVVLPIHALSAAESVLLVRELPHLGALLRDAPTAERAVDRSAANLRLARRVLTMAQGHPRLLELADRAAAEPDRLTEALDTAEAAGRGSPVTEFLATGASALDGAHFGRLLTAWTSTALSRLPEPARTLVELLAHVEQADRKPAVIGAVWPMVWQPLHGEPTPSLDQTLTPLVSALLVQVEAHGADDAAEGRLYRLHRGVGEAIRAGTDPAFGTLVDEAMIDCLTAVHAYAHAEERQGRSGAAIAWSGLASAPYLLRRGQWAEATEMLGAATDRQTDPETTNRALGYLRRMIEHDAEVLQRPAVALLHAGLISRTDPEAAVGMYLDTVRECRASGRFDLASTAMADCVTLCQQDGDLDQALKLIPLLRELTDLAGYGPWTQVADECLELTIRCGMGERQQSTARAVALVEFTDTLPEVSDTPERVTPVSVREVVLSTALDTAASAGDWHVALELCERIEQLHLRRGASLHERARLRLNSAVVLVELNLADDAEAVLRDIQAVFEEAEDIVGLGEVFGLRAEVRGRLGRDGDALTMAQASLRYSYQHSSPGVLAAGHDRLAHYLALNGHADRLCLAHRVAAAVLREATSRAGKAPMVVDTSDLFDHGPDLFPQTLDELVESVERMPGTRFEPVLSALVPGETEQNEVFESVVAPLRDRARIAREALADHYEQRTALIEAIRCVEDGEGELGSLLSGLDGVNKELFGAILGLRDRQTRSRRAAARHAMTAAEDASQGPGTVPVDRPRLFGPQVVPAMAGHTGVISLVAFVELAGRPIAVSADDESLQWWDLDTHRPIGEPVRADRNGRLWAAALGSSVTGPVVVTSVGSELELWDPSSRSRSGVLVSPYPWRSSAAISALACSVHEGRSLAATGSYDATVRLWDLDRREQIGAPLVGPDTVVRTVAFGLVDGRPVVLTGGEVDVVQVWDVRDHRAAGVLEGHRDHVRSIATGNLDGLPVAVTGGRDGSILLWDLRRYEQLGEPLTVQDGAVDALAFGVLQGRPVVVSGGADRTVRLWDLETRSQTGAPMTEGRVAMGVRSVVFGRSLGRPAVLAGYGDGILRVWSLDAHHELGNDVPARFAAELPNTWTAPGTGETYALTGPIVDDTGEVWVVVDFDGIEPILAEPASLDVTLNIRDVHDTYGLSAIVSFRDSGPDPVP